MTLLWTPGDTYRQVEYQSEQELESSIQQVKTELFGRGRLYLDVKKKIGMPGGQRNIPDGYLIDLTGSRPKLYVVEVELGSHDPLRHVAVQILQFSLSFETEPLLVKKVLAEAIRGQTSAVKTCEQYAAAHEFRNLDHMLEWLVSETPFTGLVIIDEPPDNLENVLAKKFQFGVELVELRKYQNAEQGVAYRFEPFLSGIEDTVEGDSTRTRRARNDLSDIDTVVVPARDEGFEQVFLGAQCWHAVRLHGSMRPQIKHIAAYRVAPTSAFTHVAEIRLIEAWQDTSKFVLYFREPAEPIEPIPFVKGGHLKSFQSLRYTSIDKIRSAKTIDDIW